MNKSNKPIKVLIAEDEDVLRRMYAKKFKTEGFEVFEAVNGVETIEMVKKNKPDIVLLDIIMPLVDGFSILKKMKEDNSLKNIPVILLTNLAQEPDVKEGLKLGAVDYLVKTNFTPAQIVEKVRKILKK